VLKKITPYLLIVSLTLTVSCNFNKNENLGKVIARVGDSYLYESDIDGVVKGEMSSSDSLLIVEAYINRWARKKILLQKAELNLSEEETNFNKLIEEYRVGLITSAYKQKLVSQYLDTIIKPSEVEVFYQSHKSNFILNNDLAMIRYAIFPKKISEKRNIIKLMRSNNLEDFSKLEALCYQFSDNFSLNDSTWLPLYELKMKLPQLKTAKKSQLLKKDNFIEKQDSLHLYLTRILDVRKRGEIAPIDFVKDRINNISSINEN
jgi:hypothetical protein